MFDGSSKCCRSKACIHLSSSFMLFCGFCIACMTYACAYSSQQAEDTTTAAAAPVAALTPVTPAHVKSSNTVTAERVKIVNQASSAVSAEQQYVPKHQPTVGTRSSSSSSSSWNSSGSGNTAIVQPVGSQIAPAVKALVRDSAPKQSSSSSAAAVSMQNATAVSAGSDSASQQQQASGAQQQQQQQSKQPLWLQRPRSNVPTRVQ
jgi:hypothetical protein